MGCDIHMHYEIEKNGYWQHLDWEKEFQIGTYDDGSPKRDYDKIFNHPLYIGRNYDLFAILANVRNGRGFAGVETGTGFKPISMPRGLPVDCTSGVKEQSENWGLDGHSHSWMLLSELLAFDYDNQFTVQYGVVDEAEYVQWKEVGKPKSWCGGVSGRSIKHVSNGLMEGYITGDFQKEEGIEYYTKVQWRESYRESVGPQWFETLEYLKRLGVDSTQVRLVFWFDN